MMQYPKKQIYMQKRVVGLTKNVKTVAWTKQSKVVN